MGKFKFRFISILFVIVLCSSTVMSQSFEWAIPLEMDNGSQHSLTCISVVTTPDQVHVCGPLAPAEFHQYEKMGDLAYNVYDYNGIQISSKVYEGTGMCHDLIFKNNHTYVLGEYANSINFDEIVLTTETDQVRVFLLKMDLSGEIIWHLDLGNINDHRIDNMDVDVEGNIHLARSNFGGESDILHLDEDGEAYDIWPEVVNWIPDLTVDEAGNIYQTSGCFESVFEFNGTAVPSPFDYTTVITKFNQEGEMIYCRLIEDVTCSTSRIVPDADGGAYFIGFPHLDGEIDGFPIVSPEWSFAILVIKLDALGNVEWTRNIGNHPDPGAQGDAMFGLGNCGVLRDDGGLYLTGFTRWMVDWGNGFESQVGIDNALMIWGINQDGNTDMVIVSEGSYDEGGLTMSTHNGEDHFVVVNAYDTLIVGDVEIPNDGVNYYLVKWNNDPVGVAEFDTSFITHYPDPANDQIRFKGLQNKASLFIYDISGRLVLETKVSPYESVSNLKGLVAGTYFLQLFEDGQLIYNQSLRLQ